MQIVSTQLLLWIRVLVGFIRVMMCSSEKEGGCVWGAGCASPTHHHSLHTSIIHQSSLRRWCSEGEGGDEGRNVNGHKTEDTRFFMFDDSGSGVYKAVDPRILRVMKRSAHRSNWLRESPTLRSRRCHAYYILALPKNESAEPRRHP